jgi:hypothetical protein
MSYKDILLTFVHLDYIILAFWFKVDSHTVMFIIQTMHSKIQNTGSITNQINILRVYYTLIDNVMSTFVNIKCAKNVAK